MEKMRMESENYVYKKEIDWSTLMEGFTLPLDNQVIFLRNMENFLQRGQSKIIHFFMNGKTYDAKIVNMNNSVEKRFLHMHCMSFSLKNLKWSVRLSPVFRCLLPPAPRQHLS